MRAAFEVSRGQLKPETNRAQGRAKVVDDRRRELAQTSDSQSGDSSGSESDDETGNPIDPTAQTDSTGDTGGADSDDSSSSDGIEDQDNDDIPDDSDNCPTLPNSDQLDSDADDLGDVCDTDTACGPELEWTPIIGEEAAVSSGQAGICIDCSVQDESYVIDLDLSNHARLTTPLGLAGSNFVIVDSGQAHDAGTRVGFVVSNPDGPLSADLLMGLTLQTHLDGELQETAGAGGLLTLDLLELGDGTGRILVGAETTLEFDSASIAFNSAVGVLSEFDVVVACVSASEGE